MRAIQQPLLVLLQEVGGQIGFGWLVAEIVGAIISLAKGA